MISKDTKHLWMLAGLLVGGLAVAVVFRQLAIPPSFGAMGFFRASHLQEEAARSATLVAVTGCLECHPKVGEASQESPHARVNCLHCHGVGRQHGETCKAAAELAKAQGSEKALCTGTTASVTDLHVKWDSAVCAQCHAKLTGRPKGFKQIVIASHLKKYDAANPDSPEACKECHQPHNPAEEPEEDSAGVTTDQGS